MRVVERNDWWLVLVVLVCLAGSVPRGIGEPVPDLQIDLSLPWLTDLHDRVQVLIFRQPRGSGFELHSNSRLPLPLAATVERI